MRRELGPATLALSWAGWSRSRFVAPTSLTPMRLCLRAAVTASITSWERAGGREGDQHIAGVPEAADGSGWPVCRG